MTWTKEVKSFQTEAVGDRVRVYMVTEGGSIEFMMTPIDAKALSADLFASAVYAEKKK